MSFLGVWFDTEKMTLEVTPDRLIEISELVVMWLNKEKARKKEVQSLLGKLNFVSSCVKPCRILISRVLNFLREFSNNDQVLDVSNELRGDMLWCSKFLLTYNRISIISLEEWTEPDLFFSCDACLTGFGGMSGSEYFHCEFPEFVSEHNFYINALELLTVIVCLKVWAIKRKKICIYCDNNVSVQFINKGRTRSRILQSCLRDLVFVCAVQQSEIKAIHVSSKDNQVADLLSRWNLSPSFQEEFKNCLEYSSRVEVNADPSLFRFQHDW
ncbi:unnamed protein product [Mytilus coruscus]|uniref:RNase H type-1 domain-containing protein n=1 Tax=Mytilus coruscus TaxID=42192 RepID=A0A6J8A2D7_MYTCO|nr:unnamed protein product [Mytilus coruscus]